MCTFLLFLLKRMRAHTHTHSFKITLVSYSDIAGKFMRGNIIFLKELFILADVKGNSIPSPFAMRISTVIKRLSAENK